MKVIMRKNQRFINYTITRFILFINLFGLTVVGGACNAKPTAVFSPTVPSVSQIEYVGHVLDQDTKSPISSAKVIFEFQGAPPVVYTDSEGVYRVTINAENDKVSGRVRVEADNYGKYDRNITLYTNPLIEDIRLVPFTPVPPTQLPTLTNILIEYVGHVLNQDTKSPISSAKVIFEFQGAPPVVYTDSEGVYRVTIKTDSDKVLGRVRVEADNYEKYDRNITLYANPLIEDIRLVPFTPVPPTQLPTPTNIPPTPACAAVIAPFDIVWNSVREKIGCPTGNIMILLIK